MYVQPWNARVACIAVRNENEALGVAQLPANHLLCEHQDENVDRKTAARRVCGDPNTKPGRCCGVESIVCDHRLILPTSKKLLPVGKRCEAFPRNFCTDVVTHHVFRLQGLTGTLADMRQGRKTFEDVKQIGHLGH